MKCEEIGVYVSIWLLYSLLQCNAQGLGNTKCNPVAVRTRLSIFGSLSNAQDVSDHVTQHSPCSAHVCSLEGLSPLLSGFVACS